VRDAPHAGEAQTASGLRELYGTPSTARAHTFMTAIDTPARSVRRPAPLPWRIAAALVTVAAAMLFAWVVASWTWRWFGPAPVAMPTSSVPEPWAPAIVAVPLFGADASRQAAASQASAPAGVMQGDARLLGVFAGREGEGYALFRFTDRGPVLAKTGQDIARDVTLEAVRPDGVRLLDHGEARDIVLRAPGAMRSTDAGASVRPSRNVAACAAPAGYKGPVYRINAELLGGMAAQPETWRALFTPGAGGLTVRDESGFAGMLGLKAGDRLTSASGIGLAVVDDILVAVVRPLQASQPVRVMGDRDGKPLEWLLVNAATCAG
jgi:Type II secretion system protein C